jgi:pyruvate dehydrogenase E1 component beta subunit
MHVNDFLPRAMDQLVNEAAKMQYVSGNQTKLPLVIRANVNTGLGNGVNHSQSLEALFMHIPGLQIAVPTTPYDAKGLLKTAIRGGNPVLFFEPGRLYFKKGLVPSEEYTLPFGQASIRKQGDDVTVVAEMYMVDIALECAAKLDKEGINVEVIEPRTLIPLDKKAISESVKKTGRLVTAEMGCKTGGIGAEIAATIAEECLDYLEQPIKRVAARDTPVPYSRVLEKAVLPGESDLLTAIKQVA